MTRMTYPRLRNAPIVEALIDLRVEASPRLSLDALRGLHDALKTRFPRVRELRELRASVKLSFAAESRIAGEGKRILGFAFEPADGLRVVQARLDGFTFNKLRPYEGWELLRDEARELCAAYVRSASPVRACRVGIRTINRIEIPLPIRDLSDYLLTGVVVAPALPQEVAHYFARLVLPDTVTQSIAVVLETIEDPTPDGSRLPVILDIEAFRNVSTAGDLSRAWRDLEDLRHLKNRVFFESLTDRAKELFQ